MTRLAGRLLPWWRYRNDAERLWLDERAREDNRRSRWFAMGQLAACFVAGFAAVPLTAPILFPWIVDDGRTEPILGLPRDSARWVASIGLLVAHSAIGWFTIAPLRRVMRLGSIRRHFDNCDRCGQSLEGLTASQAGHVRCPECGLDRPVVAALLHTDGRIEPDSRGD